MALALALSVMGGAGAGLVCMARMTHGMASYRALPPVLGRVSPRFSTPAIATIISSVILIAAAWAYLLPSSLATVFTDVINTTGLRPLRQFSEPCRWTCTSEIVQSRSSGIEG